jgi:hypothetical protein
MKKQQQKIVEKQQKIVEKATNDFEKYVEMESNKKHVASLSKNFFF